MKKTSKIIALVLVLMMILSSCGKSESRNFSDGLDENGYIEGIKASDYVEIGDVDDIKIDQDEIDFQIDYLTEYYFPDEVKAEDRVITSGDCVNIDYVGKIDGVAFDNGSATGQTVDIENSSFIDGFLESIPGHQPGDTFDAECQFPDEYTNNPDLAGKKAVFTITVNYIVEYKKAEFTDDFVQNNLTSLFYQTYGVYVKTAEDCINLFKTMSVQEHVYAECKLKEDAEIPQSVIDYIKNSTILTIKNYAENSQGVELITYLESAYNVKTEEEFFTKFEEEIKQEAEEALIFQALAEHYGLSVSDDYLKEVFTGAEDTITYEDAVEHYGAPYLKQYFLQDVVWKHVDTLVAFE